jgi:crotonobetainyl-CoA:carnitine CoA-transferase CaiB-like acyl-CoA transferase
MGSGPLAGVKVVELGVWVAGPSVAGSMADWGADVVKVEPPAGDPFRRLFSALGLGLEGNPPFALDNRGKRSVVLDLHVPEAMEAMEALLGAADVFVTNLRPDALDRLGLDATATTARHPRLVYGSISGYGLGGPDRDRPAYDLGAFFGRSGLAHQLAVTGEPPPNVRGGVGDHVTGMTALAGICAALFERDRTGRGQVVETSLVRAGLYAGGWDMGLQLAFGALGKNPHRDGSYTPQMNTYRGSDGGWFYLLQLEGDRHWPALVAAVDRPDLLTDERFTTAAARVKQRRALVALLDEVFAAATRDEWGRRFDAHDVWWAPALTPEEVIADPHLLATGAFRDLVIDEDTTWRSVASPVTFHDHDASADAPVVPALGADTDDVLTEVGLAADAIARLRAAGALGSG